ncbi:TetR/AcrR family transcriptional regulator [Ruminococcaceae bacterium OttesenSCG-928-L11]|nr:TetR/AcrR family transcriptional regulator [Ruminococcaceae bacterium OttesenSCG-928-L11]
MPKQTFFNLPDAKREFIIQVAVAEFAERGYKEASITHIVQEAGIAKGSFYQYFEDKDDLYIHIVTTYIADRKIMVFQKEKQRLEDLSLTEFLRLVFRQQISEFNKNPHIMKIALDMVKHQDEPVHKRILARYQPQVGTYFLEFIQHEMAQGEIDSRVNPQLLNFMLVSLGQYLLHRYISSDIADINEDTIDEMVDDLHFILRNGIYTDQTPGC